MSDKADAVINRLKNSDSEAVQRSTVMVRDEPRFALTAGELAAVCDKAPNQEHPRLKVFRNAIVGFRPDDKVVIDRVDLEAVLDNLDVEETTEETVELIKGIPTKVPVVRKTLVKRAPRPVKPMPRRDQVVSTAPEPPSKQ